MRLAARRGDIRQNGYPAGGNACGLVDTMIAQSLPRTRTSASTCTAENFQYAVRPCGESRAARPRFSLLTRIPLQHPVVTKTHIAYTVQAGQKLAQTDPGKSVAIMHQDIGMLPACSGGFCSAIVRFARSRDIRARRARAAASSR
jgi:hypothetical protein